MEISWHENALPIITHTDLRLLDKHPGDVEEGKPPSGRHWRYSEWHWKTKGKHIPYDRRRILLWKIQTHCRSQLSSVGNCFGADEKLLKPRHEPSENLLCLFEFPIIVSPPRQIECRAALKSWESESSSCSLSGSITFFSLYISHSTSTSHRKWAGPGSTRSLELLCEVSMTRAKKKRLSERDQKSIFDAIVRARNTRERFNSGATLLHVAHSVAFILFNGIGTRSHVQ